MDTDGRRVNSADLFVLTFADSVPEEVSGTFLSLVPSVPLAFPVFFPALFGLLSLR